MPSKLSPSYKWKAFISYRHTARARAIAESLESALRTYAIPKYRFPRRVFRDEQVLRPGDPLAESIRNALEETEYLIYLAEREAAESRWVREELETWCKHLGRTNRLIIVHIGDKLTFSHATMEIDWEETDAIPAEVRPHLATNPIVADLAWVRGGQDHSLQNAKFKLVINGLVAAIEGVTPEEMTGKEILAFRKNRRVLVGAVCALLALTTIAIRQAWINAAQRDDAFRVATASQLATHALQTEFNDRTMAFAVACRAYRTADTSTNRRLAYGWYADRTFYSRELYHRGHSVGPLAWSRTGLLVGHGPEATLWRSTNESWTPQRCEPNSQATMAVGFLHNGSELVTIGFGQSVARWNAADGKPLSRFRLGDQADAFALAPDAAILLASTLNNGLQLYDVSTGQRLVQLQLEDAQPDGAIAATRDGTLLAIGVKDGAILLVDRLGQRKQKLESHRDQVLSLTFSSDGQTLVSGSEDQTAVIWNVADGKPVRNLQGQFAPISAVAVRADGRIALGSSDGRIGLRGRDGSHIRRW